MKLYQKILVLILIIVVAISVVELFLFVSFIKNIKNFEYKFPPNADAIICLTGGYGRVDEGLKLLSQGNAPVLLISGTYQQSKLSQIIEESGFEGDIDETKIILESSSQNTMENSEEAYKFVTSNNYQSIILVTSVYHIKRANYIFRKIIPKEIEIFTHPIRKRNLTYKKMFSDPKLRNFIMLEFIKYSWYRLVLI